MRIAEELRNDMLELSESRRTLWDAMFRKFESEGKLNQSSYSVDELSDSVKDDPLFSNNVNRDDLTEDGRMLVSEIEEDLHSNLKQLILKREKAKLMLDRKYYKQIHPKLKREIKRLMKNLPEEDLTKYVRLCIVSNERVKEFIEDTLQSNFKKLLLEIQQPDSNKNDLKILKHAVSEQWKYLSKFLTEEEIVVYAVRGVSERI